MTSHRRPHLIGGDRNQRALREHHHKQFVERVAQRLVQPQDRFCDPIAVGDLVLFTPELLPLTGEVHSIDVVPLAQQPPEGSIFVRLMLTFSASVGGYVDHPLVQLVVKKKEAEWKAPAAGASPPDDPPPASEIPDDPTDPPA